MRKCSIRKDTSKDILGSSAPPHTIHLVQQDEFLRTPLPLTMSFLFSRKMESFLRNETTRTSSSSSSRSRTLTSRPTMFLFLIFSSVLVSSARFNRRYRDTGRHLKRSMENKKMRTKKSSGRHSKTTGWSMAVTSGQRSIWMTCMDWSFFKTESIVPVLWDMHTVHKWSVKVTSRFFSVLQVSFLNHFNMDAWILRSCKLFSITVNTC